MTLLINLRGHFVLATAELWKATSYFPRQKGILVFLGAIIILFLNEIDLVVFIWISIYSHFWKNII